LGRAGKAKNPAQISHRPGSVKKTGPKSNHASGPSNQVSPRANPTRGGPVGRGLAGGVAGKGRRGGFWPVWWTNWAGVGSCGGKTESRAVWDISGGKAPGLLPSNITPRFWPGFRWNSLRHTGTGPFRAVRGGPPRLIALPNPGRGRRGDWIGSGIGRFTKSGCLAVPAFWGIIFGIAGGAAILGRVCSDQPPSLFLRTGRSELGGGLGRGVQVGPGAPVLRASNATRREPAATGPSKGRWVRSICLSGKPGARGFFPEVSNPRGRGARQGPAVKAPPKGVVFQMGGATSGDRPARNPLKEKVRGGGAFVRFRGGTFQKKRLLNGANEAGP